MRNRKALEIERSAFFSGDREEEKTTNDSLPLLHGSRRDLPFASSDADSNEYFGAHLFGRSFCSFVMISILISNLYFIYSIAHSFCFLLIA